MYQDFYGLHRPPFAVTPDPSLLYMSEPHREALATIIYGVETRKGFLVCTGEVGTGKTTIVRAFFDQTSAEAVKLLHVFTPQVSPLEMATYICGELGIPAPDNVFSAMPQLQLKLLEVFESGRTTVLLIDEAQLLPAETLEFLRLLSNFETDREKLIQIVLVGQPELDALLDRRDMRQVAQRIALRAKLRPFTFDESLEYIEHRLVASGAVQSAQVLSATSTWMIAETAGGIPRIINILADNVLIAGFGANQRPVSTQLAANTIREFVAKSGSLHTVKPRRRFAAGRLSFRSEGRRDSPIAPLRPGAAGAPTQAPVEPRPAPRNLNSTDLSPDQSVKTDVGAGAASVEQSLPLDLGTGEPILIEPVFIEPVLLEPEPGPEPQPLPQHEPEPGVAAPVAATSNRARIIRPVNFVRGTRPSPSSSFRRSLDPFAKIGPNQTDAS